MASTINGTSTGNGGLISTGDDSGILNIQTNETTAITVDASQIVSYTNNLGTVAGYPAYQCRAWVNFNGTGTVAIRASGNVSSITDNGTGDYTVNFTTALSDANYVASANASRLNDRNTFGNIGYQSTYAGNRTTTILRVYSMTTDGFTLTDTDMFDVIVIR
jgi:hypothetical protein